MVQRRMLQVLRYVLQGQCEQRYTECNKLSLKTTYQEVSIGQHHGQQDFIVFFLVQKSEAVMSVKKDFVKNTTEAPSEEYEYEYYDDEEEKSEKSEE